MHKHTILEVKDDRFLYKRACSTLKSLVRGVLVDIVVPIFFRGKLDNEAMRETFLSRALALAEKRKTCSGYTVPAALRVMCPSHLLSILCNALRYQDGRMTFGDRAFAG